VDLKTSSCPEGRLCHTSVVNDDKMYIYGGHITQVGEGTSRGVGINGKEKVERESGRELE
jgi:hypothetical protein